LVVVLSAAVVVHAVGYNNAAVKDAVYLGVLVGASVGAWIGAERAPDGLKLVPRLIAAGISLSALGDVLWTVLDLMGSGTNVSIADPAWFASYALLCAALCVVLSQAQRRGHGLVDVDFVIDALTIVVVSLVIFWNTSIDSILGDHSVAPFVRAVWASYPVADAVLLALVVRVLMSRSARAAIGPSFAVGVCLWLTADVTYLQAPTGTGALVIMDTAWMVAPVLLARAAWRARGIGAEATDPQAVGGRMAQLVVAVGALAVPPVLELVNDLRGEPNQPILLLASTATLIALAFVRTSRLLSSEARARRELEEARDAALAGSRAKTMFLANMSHEIRTPLTTVLAVGEILEDTPLEASQLDLLRKMHRSGEMLKALVERTLDFSRVEAGLVVAAATPFDLRTLVADVADVYEPRAIHKGIRFEWHVDPGMPQMLIGDPNRILQIITNLLDNALKFTDRGKVGLLVRPARAEENESHSAVGAVEFIVYDTGIGIPEEARNAVFESFTQVDGSETRRYSGSGLGLAICKELTQLMGGSITLLSQSGTGSRFVIRIPMAAALEEHITANGSPSLRNPVPMQVFRSSIGGGG